MPTETGRDLIESIRSQLGLEPEETNEPAEGFDAWLQEYEPEMFGEDEELDESRWKPAFKPPQYKQLMANIEAFHDMVKSHRADLAKAEKLMKQLEPAMKQAGRGDGRSIPDMVELMLKVNKDMNECHGYLGGAAEELFKAVAVELPDWK